MIDIDPLARALSVGTDRMRELRLLSDKNITQMVVCRAAKKKVWLLLPTHGSNNDPRSRRAGSRIQNEVEITISGK